MTRACLHVHLSAADPFAPVFLGLQDQISNSLNRNEIIVANYADEENLLRLGTLQCALILWYL